MGGISGVDEVMAEPPDLHQDRATVRSHFHLLAALPLHHRHYQTLLALHWTEELQNKRQVVIRIHCRMHAPLLLLPLSALPIVSHPYQTVVHEADHVKALSFSLISNKSRGHVSTVIQIERHQGLSDHCLYPKALL